MQNEPENTNEQLQPIEPHLDDKKPQVIVVGAGSGYAHVKDMLTRHSGKTVIVVDSNTDEEAIKAYLKTEAGSATMDGGMVAYQRPLMREIQLADVPMEQLHDDYFKNRRQAKHHNSKHYNVLNKRKKNKTQRQSRRNNRKK